MRMTKRAIGTGPSRTSTGEGWYRRRGRTMLSSEDHGQLTPFDFVRSGTVRSRRRAGPVAATLAGLLVAACSPSTPPATPTSPGAVIRLTHSQLRTSEVAKEGLQLGPDAQYERDPMTEAWTIKATPKKAYTFESVDAGAIRRRSVPPPNDVAGRKGQPSRSRFGPGCSRKGWSR